MTLDGNFHLAILIIRKVQHTRVVGTPEENCTKKNQKSSCESTLNRLDVLKHRRVRKHSEPYEMVD